MKLETLVLLLALASAPACGGGGGAGVITDPGGSPSPLAASFSPEQQPTPPANYTVAMGEGAKSNDEVIVNVTLTEARGVAAVEFEVAFDDAQLAYLGSTPGVALEQGGVTPVYLAPKSPSPIFVSVTRPFPATATNVSGTRLVIGLRFRVKQVGNSPLTIHNQLIYGAGQPPQPISASVSWYAGAVQGL